MSSYRNFAGGNHFFKTLEFEGIAMLQRAHRQRMTGASIGLSGGGGGEQSNNSHPSGGAAG
jgi:hypothetical protein